jgi:tRNA modification GTPase
MNQQYQDTIIALATPAGSGAIGIIRLSGKEAITTVNQFFEGKFKAKDLCQVKSHSIHLGYIKDDTKIIDEVLVSIFKNPHSYTGENVVEISVHGSTYIQQQVLQLFLKNGVRHAQAGEFTLRAFLNGKMDLSQAEAVADLIASDSETSHQLALQQMRGGFSNEIKKLRAELIHFASLIELELDFAEEDVEFADRKQFSDLVQRIKSTLKKLVDSFAVGNVLKEGVPVAIIGEPNVGKSTLLNALLNEERAIVSDIAGTTRDVIEDELILDGIRFRFIDTAGIRKAQDEIEKIGIRKTYEKIGEAKVVIFLIDACALSKTASCHSQKHDLVLNEFEKELQNIAQKYPDKKILIVVNKIDKIDEKDYQIDTEKYPVIEISAKQKTGIEQLTKQLTSLVNKGELNTNDIIVSNARHYHALNEALQSILQVEEGITTDLSTDLMTIDIRAALHSLGEITGEISTDDLLDNIFRNFCIGK